MSERASPPSEPVRVGAMVASRILGISPRQFAKMVAAGKLTVFEAPPGTNARPTYSLAEIEALRDASVRPATAAV